MKTFKIINVLFLIIFALSCEESKVKEGSSESSSSRDQNVDVAPPPAPEVVDFANEVNNANCGTPDCLNEGTNAPEVIPPDENNPEKTVTLVRYPRGIVTDPELLFEFNCGDQDCETECRIDDEDFISCKSPWTAVVRDSGDHIAYIRAVDSTSSYASARWRSDVRDPNTLFGSRPAEVTGKSANFHFYCTDDLSTYACSFECVLDGGQPIRCGEEDERVVNFTLSDLSSGTHTLRVTAIDEAGRRDPSPLVVTWETDLSGPDIVLGSLPAKLIGGSVDRIRFVFYCDRNPCSNVQCFFNDTSNTCSSPYSINPSSLGDGDWSFKVVAENDLGVSGESSVYNFSIDQTGPSFEVMVMSDLDVNAHRAVIDTTCSEANNCQIVGCTDYRGNNLNCSFPYVVDQKTYRSTGLYEIRAADEAGNVATRRLRSVFGESSFRPKLVMSNNMGCRLDQQGRVFCWGNNEDNFGFFNRPYESVVYNQIEIASVANGHTHYIDLLANSRGFCALSAPNYIPVCWGDLTDWTSSSDPSRSLVSDGPVAFPAISFAMAGFYATPGEGMCFDSSEGVASRVGLWRYLCMGDNYQSQLAIDQPSGRYSVLRYIRGEFPRDDGSVEVNDASENCIALSNREVYCRGSNFYGRSGFSLDSITMTHTLSEYKKLTNLNANIIQLTSGSLHSCGLDDRGIIYCWGGNTTNQLGHNGVNLVVTSNPRGGDPLPVYRVTNVPGTVMDLRAGGNTTCALNHQSDIYCWGSNSAGVLGQDPSVLRTTSTPQRIGFSAPVVSFDLEKSLSLPYATEQLCAVLVDETVECIGMDFATINNATASYHSQPYQLGEPTSVSASSACMANSDCRDGTCYLGTCQQLAGPGESCDDNYDCETSGFTCASNNTCTDPDAVARAATRYTLYEYRQMLYELYYEINSMNISGCASNQRTWKNTSLNIANTLYQTVDNCYDKVGDRSLSFNHTGFSGRTSSCTNYLQNLSSRYERRNTSSAQCTDNVFLLNVGCSYTDISRGGSSFNCIIRDAIEACNFCN